LAQDDASRARAEQAAYASAVDCCIRRGYDKAAVRRILRMQVKCLEPSREHLQFLQRALARFHAREIARIQADVRAWAALAGVSPGRDVPVTTWWR
jgi:hypothetical protein